jgi:hypothetical protein
MNHSRRLMIQMASMGVATSCFASLRSATATTLATNTVVEELLKFQSSVQSRTSTRAATLAFANELRANRDDALKRLVGPAFASRLSELPLSTRTTVGNLVFDLVGNSSTPAPKLSPTEIDELSVRLNDGMVISGFFIFDTWIDTDFRNLPDDHLCKEYEDAIREAIRRCIDAYAAYIACETPKKRAVEDDCHIFSPSAWTTKNFMDAGGDCRSEYNQLVLELAAYQRAVSAYNWCMAPFRPWGDPDATTRP